MATKDFLNLRLTQLKNEVPKLKKKIGSIEDSLNALDSEIETFTTKIETLSTAIDNHQEFVQRGHDRQVRRLEKVIAELERKLKRQGVPMEVTDNVNSVVLDKAKTIAIFDAILNAITGWSTSGDQATDVEAATQTILFPCVYERVMTGGDPAYLLEDVPETAELVVQRGREYVRWVRSECPTHITTPEYWAKYAPEVQKWWIQDGLPLLYGEADPEWGHDKPYTLEEIEVWRKNPADRMTAFPQIQDAMDILQSHRQDVNKTTRLVQFNQAMTANRLQ